MIAYYLSGEKPIPKTVMLATEGWAAREEAWILNRRAHRESSLRWRASALLARDASSFCVRIDRVSELAQYPNA
ncbi:MAG: hypothetical protein AB7P97_01370 [Hyphomonadaceae bacterium]